MTKTTIRFEQVSKQYRLGLNRTSLLKAFSNTVRRVYRAGAQESAGREVLWALHDVSFELPQGESLALIGRNGAGKSTTLKLLANITRPTSGQIDVRGRLSALIELGSGFHPDLTGRENIYLNGTILGLSRSELRDRFDEIVAFSELERFIETPVKRYSSGMLVRLGFAVASCIEPNILLVDEVLAVGDASFRQKCLKRIQALLNDGTSIIFVSHNLFMVQAVCASALYLEHGEVKHRGQTTDVIDAYERDLHEEQAREFESSRSEQSESVTEAQITGVEVLDTNGLKPDEFCSDQPVEIRVHYKAYRSSGKANASVRVIRSDGLTSCIMRTRFDDVSLALQNGDGIISVILEPLQLVGGTYHVQAHLLDELNTTILTTGWSNWFYVSGSALSHEEQRGVFEPRRKWKHHQLSPHAARVDKTEGQPTTLP